jgi:hypothetical protein
VSSAGLQTPPTWRRLAPLTVLVLAVHLALLVGEGRGVGPVRRQAVHLVTRTITPPAPPPAPAPAPPAPAMAPAPIARTAPPTPVPAPAAARSPRAPAAAPAPTPAPPPPAPAASSAPPAPAPAASAEAPRGYAVLSPRRLQYLVTVQGRDGKLQEGEATLDWQQDGHEYEATMEVFGKDLPTRVQRSVGAITAEGLAPSYFSDKARSEQATHFERDKGRVVFSNNQPDAQIAPGLQDRLSAVLQLAAMVAAEPAQYPAGTLINLPTATTRQVDNWVFSVVGAEEVVLAGDAVPTLKLERLPLKEYEQKVELWLATRMDYAPVRVRLTNPNGDVVDQRWFSTDRR